ncbi:MAG: hypothetical protein ACJ0DI_05745 [bacterium]
MKQQLSHIDDLALRELMDESKLLLKSANEHFDHERHSGWDRILTETILLIEGELQYRIENQEALLIEEATRQVKESMDHEQDQSRTINSNPSFNEELAISDLKDFQDSKNEYWEVKDKLKLIREEIDSET